MKPHLLLVDDDPDTLSLLEIAAVRSGMFASVSLAADGQDALTLLDAAGRQRPDLVVSDLRMPRMNGVELVRALKKNPRTSHLPIAILSSSEMPEDRTAAEEAGAVGFFFKGAQREVADVFRAIVRGLSRDFGGGEKNARMVS